jgi:hypothetical protein
LSYLTMDAKSPKKNGELQALNKQQQKTRNIQFLAHHPLMTRVATSNGPPTEARSEHSFGKVSVFQPSSAEPSLNGKTLDACPLLVQNPQLCPFGGACHTCPRMLQRKAALLNDMPEQQVNCTATKALKRERVPQYKEPIVPSRNAFVQRKCYGCEDEEPLVQMKEGPHQKKDSDSKSTAFKLVNNVLNSRGKPIEPVTLQFMESRLNHNFGGVRVHADTEAAESAQALNALAYTSGQDVVFGKDQYQPVTMAGQILIAHELVHTIQQKNLANLQTKPSISSPSDATEREADEIAKNVVAGKVANVSLQSVKPSIQRQACRSLLDETEIGRVSGIRAHTAILRDFTMQNSSNALRVRIPAGSSKILGARCGDDPTIEKPQEGGGKLGDGIPDLAYKSGTILEVAEIKPGSWACYPDGQQQVQNYVSKGNYTDLPFKEWRKSIGITRVRHMGTNRYSPTSPLPVEGQNISVMWCEAGLLAYKVVQHPEVIICGALSDKGKLDTFLEQNLGKAQGAVDSYITNRIEPKLDELLKDMSTQDALKLLYKYSKSLLSKFIAKQAGGGKAGKAIAEALTENLPDDKAVASLANWIDQQIGPKAKDELRKLMQRFKIILLTELRKRMQSGLREFMKESVAALCAAAISISAATLLKKIYQDMAKYIAQKLAEIVVDVAKAFVEAFAKALAYALLAVAAVVAVIAAIVLLPEVIAAAAAILAEISAVLVALAPLLARTILPRLLPTLAP